MSFNDNRQFGERWNSLWNWASGSCKAKRIRTPQLVETREEPTIIDKDRTPVPTRYDEQSGDKTPEPTTSLVLGDIRNASLFQRRQKCNRKTQTITMV